MTPIRRLFVLLGISGALLAQSYHYSPSNALTATGAGNTIPWLYQVFNSQRYQQVHNDLRGKVMYMNEIGFRRGPETTVFTGATARVIDCEMFVGLGDYATSTTNFATNYTSTPVNTVSRKQINLPDLTMPQGAPAPFTVLFPFDVPFLYLAQQDLVWEIAIYTSTGAGAYFTEGVGYDDFATTASTGTGCVATGQTNTMLQQVFIRSIPAMPAPLLDVGFRIFYGPLSAPAAILLGTPAAIPIPGLCTNLYVQNIYTSLNGGTATANGVFYYGWTMPWNPGLVGFQVTVQGVALDGGQAVLPFVATQGITATIVPVPTRGVVRRIWGNLVGGGQTDTSNGTPLPYGLVLRFKY